MAVVQADTDPAAEARGTLQDDNAQKDKLAAYLQDLTDDANNTWDQREKAREDMRFINITGGQWEDFLANYLPADRVRLELDLTSDFLYRFVGQWSLNRLGVDYKPDDSATTDDDAELANGIYRADFRDGMGKMSTDYGVLEAATCGYGAFKIGSHFVNPGDPEDDKQRTDWRTVVNAYDSVIWDRGAKLANKADARRCNELSIYTPEMFESTWPGKIPESAYQPDRNVGNTGTQMTGNYRRIYISTRYEVVKRKEWVYKYGNLKTGEIEVYNEDDHKLIEDELRMLVRDETLKFIRKRRVVNQTVQKTIFSGAEILEETRRIAGKWIPIIPIYAYRGYVDGVEWYRGLIRKLKDGQRVFNMQMSQLTENAASHGQEVPIFAAEQMQNETVAAQWSDRNNKPYLLVDPLKDDQGNIVQAGPIGYLKPPALDQSTATLLEVMPQYIQGQTGGAAQETVDPDASGKAIVALEKQRNMNTQPVNDNIACSMEWSGDVWAAIAQDIYTERRMIKIAGRDGTINQKQMFKVIQDSETGRMVEVNTIHDKKFKAYSDVGPQYETLREQTVEDIKGMVELLAQIPGGEQYMPVLLSVMMENISGVGLDPVKELNRRIMLLQGTVKPETPEEEQMVLQSQQQAQQGDAQQQLMEAAAQQQQAEARSLDASSIQKFADAQLKAAQAAKTEAETVETLAGIPEKEAATIREDLKVILDAQQVQQQTQSLPL